jgi:hypothetical protein
MALPNIKTIHIIDFNSIEDHLHWIHENRVNKHDFKINPAKLIKLDFSSSRFLKPYHIAPLACLIHEYKLRDFKIKIENIPEEIKLYLQSFSFDQFCISRNDSNTTLPSDRKTFPLWHIEESRKDFYIIEVQRYFENNHFKGQNLLVLGSSLAELMNNIFDHAKSKIPGYTFTQYNTRSNEIVTCVCDFGIGMPTAVNNFLSTNGLPKLQNNQALIKALESKFSTQSKPHNRGFGWHTIFSSLKSLSGRLLLISNNALYLLHHDGTIKSQILKSNFPGTLVVIYLDTKNLPEKEQEISDELQFL